MSTTPQVQRRDVQTNAAVPARAAASQRFEHAPEHRRRVAQHQPRARVGHRRHQPRSPVGRHAPVLEVEPARAQLKHRFGVERRSAHRRRRLGPQRVDRLLRARFTGEHRRALRRREPALLEHQRDLRVLRRGDHGHARAGDPRRHRPIAPRREDR
jgi:hypothetical protein